jgi:hypothetical protein
MVVYPLDFHRLAEQRWARRNRPSGKPETAGPEAWCPHCSLPAGQPFVSRFLSTGAVEHHWKCKSCDSDWSSVSRPPSAEIGEAADAAPPVRMLAAGRLDKPRQ